MNLISKISIFALMFVTAPMLAQQDSQDIQASYIAKESCKAVALTTGIAFLSFVIFKELTQFKNLPSYFLLNIPAAACTAAVGAYLCKLDYVIIRSEYKLLKAALQKYKEKHKQQSRMPKTVKKDLPYHVIFKF